MTPTFVISDSPAAMLAAVACVIAGGPWFADGLRALRRRRVLLGLGAERRHRLREGAIIAHGVVTLDSPLFAPLSSRPCAGFVLEVRSPHFAMVGRVRETRPFRLVTDDGVAHVYVPEAEWDLRIGSERTVRTPGELSENLVALLARTPETRWLLARGGELVVTERVLGAGSEAGVLAVARRVLVTPAVAAELARTGTDDAPQAAAAIAATEEWTLGASDELGSCVVSDRDPSPARLAPPAWRLAGAVLGPILALAGLLQLVHAVGHVGLGGR